MAARLKSRHETSLISIHNRSIQSPSSKANARVMERRHGGRQLREGLEMSIGLGMKDDSKVDIYPNTDSLPATYMNGEDRCIINDVNYISNVKSSSRTRRRPNGSPNNKRYSENTRNSDVCTNEDDIENTSRYTEAYQNGNNDDSNANIYMKDHKTVQSNKNNWRRYFTKCKMWKIRIERRQFYALPPFSSKKMIQEIALLFRSLHISRSWRYVNEIHQNLTPIPYISRAWKTILLVIATAVMLFFATLLYALRSLFFQGASICRPPQNSNLHYVTNSRPLVEYYVHGRGNGHFSRSLPIADKLNAKGYDVRMFVGRACMWREMHSTRMSNSENVMDLDTQSILNAKKARTVAKLMLFGEDMKVVESMEERYGERYDDLDNLFESLPWDNEYALNYNISVRVNDLQTTESKKRDEISRGTTSAISVTSTVPKMSLISAVSHIIERIFSACEISHQASRYPSVIIVDGDVPGMFRAKVGKIPSISISHGMSFYVSYPGWTDNYMNWQAAWKHEKRTNKWSSFMSNWLIATNFIPLETTQKNAVIAKPPFRKEVIDLSAIRNIRSIMSTEPTKDDEIESFVNIEERNKIVLCYFRDKNGLPVVDILIELGFDVVVFNAMEGKKGSEIGKKWKITTQEDSDLEEGAHFERIRQKNEQGSEKPTNEKKM